LGKDRPPSSTKVFSIFNLEIELLLEGLDGALECSDYLFHFERGFGELYTNDVRSDFSDDFFHELLLGGGSPTL
jgi:hypothetical protein